MTITLADVMLVGLPVIAGLVWLIRLEGRLNAQGERLEDRLKTQDDGLDRLERDIAYIRNRIDVALNGHRK
jgi:hypothetical protein